MNDFERKSLINSVSKIADALTKIAQAQHDLAFEAKQANKIKERMGR